MEYKYFIPLLLGRIHCRLTGVSYGKNFSPYGAPLIKKHPEATITIGDHVVLTSLKSVNLAGISRAVILAAPFAGSQISIGHHTGISGSVLYAAKSIRIGQHVNIGVNTAIYDTDFHPLDPQQRRQGNQEEKLAQEVIIDDDAWIGGHSIILKGVHIGSGAVVGAGQRGDQRYSRPDGLGRESCPIYQRDQTLKMTPIIFINKNHGLDSSLKRYAITECHVIQTLYHQEARAIYQSLAQRKISYRKIRGRDYIQEYQKTYADFIGKLNISNAGQPWWALDLTNKNPITTRLFYSVYFTLLIHKVIDAYPDQALLVITDDKALYQQTALNFSGRSECQVVNHIQGFSIKRWLQAFIPLGPLYKIIWALSGKFWARVYLPRVTTAAPRPTHLVMSLLYDPCFKAGHYQDVYFGAVCPISAGEKRSPS